MISSRNENHTPPPRYSGVKYEDVPKHIQEACTNMTKTGKGIYLFGKAGVGKTHIAYAIWLRAKEKNISAKFYKSTEMLDLIRDYYGRKGLDYSDNELKKLQDYDGLLIIDDFGVEKPTDWVAETFYKIIDRRYEACLPTVFTSNLNLGEVAEHLSDRISSRLAEMCEIIKVEGADRRL